jgi:phosphoesterase RecJ-like protein
MPKMLSPEIYQQVLQRLKSSKKVLCAAHVDPDGDAFGSAVAMALVCEGLGVPADIYCATAVPDGMRSFSYGKKIIHQVTDPTEYDCVVVNDCGDAKRVSIALPIAINIDHHLENKVPAQINMIDTNSTSTGMVIFDFMKASGISLTAPLASLFYVTILCDTGNFRWDNCTPYVFESCAEFVKAGAKPYEIYSRLNESAPPEKIQALGEGLAGIKVTHSGKTVYTVLSERSAEESSGIIDQIRKVAGTEVAALFVKLPSGDIKISLRSKTDKDVQKVVALFGGGGHKKAAGANTPGKLEDVVEKVLLEISKLY